MSSIAMNRLLKPAVSLFCKPHFQSACKSRLFVSPSQACSVISQRNCYNMGDPKLDAVPAVDIEEGIFKYVLIKVYGKEANGKEPNKLIVRGYGDCEWHSDIYDRASTSCQGLGLDTECLGGGRIEHNPSNKLIKVYGYSQGFGKADHAETKKILSTKYNNYNIEISDDGY